MSSNILKKLVSSVRTTEVARPAQRKPPQRAHAVPVTATQIPQLSPFSIPQNGEEKMAIPATWNKVIENPRVWAEIRPVIVDED